MAKMTKEQILKFNAACKNGFHLKTDSAILWGEKIIIRDIEIKGTGVIYRFKLRYKEIYERYEKKGVVPVLCIEKLIPGSVDDLYRVETVNEKEIGEMTARKNVKLLQKLTENYTDEILCKLIDDLEAVA